MAGDDQAAEQAPGLTAFQLEVARLFFTLPASSGFLLAGGAALLAQRLTDRPTQDLDFFTAPGRGDVTVARQQFEIAVRLFTPVLRLHTSASPIGQKSPDAGTDPCAAHSPVRAEDSAARSS